MCMCMNTWARNEERGAMRPWKSPSEVVRDSRMLHHGSTEAGLCQKIGESEHRRPDSPDIPLHCFSGVVHILGVE